MDANDLKVKAAEYSGISAKKFQQDAMNALSHDMTVLAMSPIVRQIITTVAMDAYEAAYRQCLLDVMQVARQQK